jgi:hypothetical protein
MDRLTWRSGMVDAKSGMDAVGSRAARRHLIPAAVVVVCAVLAGCATVAPPEATQPIESAESSPTPTPIERPDVPPPPEQLSFDAGAELDSAVWLAGWHAQPIDMTSGYPVVFPRDDWEEQHFSGDGCVASRFHRFSLEGYDLTLDDRTLTDQYLAQLLEMPVADVTDGGSDVGFPVIGRYPMMADFRVRAGDWTDGGTWLAAARVFGALGTALVVQLNCDPGPMTGATGQQMFDLLPQVVGIDGLDVGLGRVDWNVVTELDFDDGADLVTSSGASWVDVPLMEDPEWTFDEGEPDDGMWSFASADGDCVAEFEQSRLAEYRHSMGDLQASDDLLASSLEDPDEFQPQDAVDVGFALGVPGNDLVLMRSVEGSGPTGDWVTAARALTGPLLGFTVTITCATGDPTTALSLLAGKSAIRVVP